MKSLTAIVFAGLLGASALALTPVHNISAHKLSNPCPDCGPPPDCSPDGTPCP